MNQAQGHSNLVAHLGDSSYANHLSTSLNQLRQEQSLCDVTIIVDDKIFPAHKAVLSCASQYFKSMFTSEFLESTSSEVNVPGTSKCFTELIQFAYTGFFDLSPTNIAGIFKMACYMQFTQAVDICASYLIDNKAIIDIDDCFEVWSLSENFGDSLSELCMVYRGYLVQNFIKLKYSNNFLEHASEEFILTCLMNEHIETDESTELQIFEVVMAWLKFKWNDRHVHMTKLLTQVRLGLLTVETLEERFEDPDIGGKEEYRKLVSEVLNLHQNNNDDEICTEWFTTRNTVTTFLKIGSKINGSYYFDERDCYSTGCWNRLHRMATLPYPSHGNLTDFSLVVVNGELYAAGGESKYSGIARGHGGRPVYRCTTECMDNFCTYIVRTNTWIELPPMINKRKSFSMIGHDGHIYALGGVNGDGEPTRKVERYNLADREWRQIASVRRPAKSASVVSFNGCLVLCGFNQWAYDSKVTIQIYEPSHNFWYLLYELNVLKQVDDYMEIDPYSALLTVQNNDLYLVYFLDKPDKKRVTIIPKVYKVQYNLRIIPPTLTLHETVQDPSLPETNIKAFGINGKVFICKYKYVQQVQLKRDDENKAYDLSRWQNIGFSGQGSVVPFTFDKRPLVLNM